MRNTIYLIRHAEAAITIDPLLTGIPDSLTENGLSAAQLIAERCAELHIESIYTSKTARAQLTAHHIGITIAQKPVVLDFFKERKVRYINSKEYVYLETFEELKVRLITAKQYLENLPNERVAVVSHALFIRALIAYILFGNDLTEEILESITKITIIENASLSKITYDTEKAQWHIASLNDTSHLSRPQTKRTD